MMGYLPVKAPVAVLFWGLSLGGWKRLTRYKQRRLRHMMSRFHDLLF